MYSTDTSASDEAYTSFLLNSSRDYSSPAPPGGSKTATTTTNKSIISPPSNPPAGISALHSSKFYTSDIDSPFEAIEIPLPEASTASKSGVYREVMAQALGVEVEAVRKMSIAEWDPRGEYRDVVDAVQEWIAVGDTTKEAEVAVFAVEGQGARVEYFVVGLVRGEKDGEGDRLVGMKVLSVES